MSDPNETPFLRCPGVEGYSLIVRRVGSGRKSIEVMDTTGDVFPLEYQQTVTTHMFSLGDSVEWRIAANDGKRQPVALIARVYAREDDDEPERITRSFFVVAKVEPTGACVTDSIAENAEDEAGARRLADSARERRCLPALTDANP